MTDIGTLMGTMVTGSSEEACSGYARSAHTDALAAIQARLDTIAAGVHQVVSQNGQRIDFVDGTGLVLLTVTSDGAVYADKLFRPGSVGFTDRVDFFAEVAAMKAQVAGALVLSPTTAKLRSAIRQFGFYPQPGYRLAAADTPTFSMGTANSPPTISGGLVAGNDLRYSWLSGPVITKSTFAGGAGYPGDITYVARGSYTGRNAANTADTRVQNYVSVEFIHTGTAFEIMQFSAGTATPVRVLVNDMDGGTIVMPADNQGNPYYGKVTFPTVKARRVRLEGAGLSFLGIQVASGSEISATGRAYPIATVISDSFGDAGGNSPPADWEGIIMARALGFSVAAAPVGSTGLVNAGMGAQNFGGGLKVNFADPKRMIDLTLAGVTSAQVGAQASPDIGIVCGSINDCDANIVNASVWGSYASSLQDAVTRNAYKLIDAWQAANPGKPLVFFGPTTPASPPTLDTYRVRDGMHEAAEAARSANVHFIDRLMPPMRIGAASDTAAQASLYTGATGPTDPHPTPAGHRFDGLTMADRLRGLIMAEMV